VKEKTAKAAKRRWQSQSARKVKWKKAIISKYRPENEALGRQAYQTSKSNGNEIAKCNMKASRSAA